MRVADYLSALLWAMFDRVTRCQRWSHGADAVQALETYAQQDHLRASTLFVTFSMDNICAVLPHGEALDVLEHFLRRYAPDDEIFQKEGMTIDTVLRLVRLVLNNQFFVYSNRFYRQTVGCASGSPLTMPLAYIYLFHWKQALISTIIDNTEELFGR